MPHTLCSLHIHNPFQHYEKWAEQPITIADAQMICIFQYFFPSTLCPEDTFFFDHSGRPYVEQLT